MSACLLLPEHFTLIAFQQHRYLYSQRAISLRRLKVLKKDSWPSFLTKKKQRRYGSFALNVYPGTRFPVIAPLCCMNLHIDNMLFVFLQIIIVCLFCAECLCSMWLRSGTSEIWHWRWDLLCLYRDLKPRLKKGKTKMRMMNDAILMISHGLFFFSCFTGTGWSCAQRHAGESCVWRGYRWPANILGSGMRLRCHFSQSAEESASGEICVYCPENDRCCFDDSTFRNICLPT